jgi:hypothetical protein
MAGSREVKVHRVEIVPDQLISDHAPKNARKRSILELMKIQNNFQKTRCKWSILNS